MPFCGSVKQRFLWIAYRWHTLRKLPAKSNLRKFKKLKYKKSAQESISDAQDSDASRFAPPSGSTCIHYCTVYGLARIRSLSERRRCRLLCAISITCKTSLRCPVHATQSLGLKPSIEHKQNFDRTKVIPQNSLLRRIFRLSFFLSASAHLYTLSVFMAINRTCAVISGVLCYIHHPLRE